MSQQIHVVESPHTSIKPDMEHTIPEFLEKDFPEEWLDFIAYECYDTETKLTFRQVFGIANGVGSGLIKNGLKKRDVCGVILPNIPHYTSIILGILKAGGICSPCNPMYTNDEIQRQLVETEAKFVFTIPPFEKRLVDIKETIEQLANLIIVVVGSSEIPSNLTLLTLSETPCEGVQFLKGSEIATDEEIAILPFSSGTTGNPKGVSLTHTNICTQLLQLKVPNTLLFYPRKTGYSDSDSEERFIGILPFFHMFGMIIFNFLGLCYGSHTVTMSKFDPVKFISILRRHKPTTLHLVTPIISMMVNHPGITKGDFSSIHTVIAGAAPIGKILISRFLAKADREIHFQEGFGMTELSPVTNILNPILYKDRIGSCGTLLSGTLAKIICPDTGNSLGPNEVGEFWIKGPQMMKEYYRNQESTLQTIHPSGYLKTGDIAYYDSEGCFYIVDRLKELIKVKGLQVAPSEIENILRNHELISDAAVIGVPNEKTGESPRAYIVRKSESLNEADVFEFVKGKLAPFKYLTGGVVFMEAIPKAASGKILRRILKKQYEEELLRKDSIETTKL